MISKKEVIALLTEVLPYELPIRFNNEDFLSNILTDEGWNFFKSLYKLADWSIPMRYSVRKYGGNKLRELALVHPMTQVELARFINRYEAILTYQCNLSPFSLRHIEAVSCKKLCYDIIDVYPSDDDLNSREIENELNSKDEKIRRSYFTYKEVDFAFKFYEGFSFLRLEQKYKMMRKLDISQCFYHIYTHSICWAIKGKHNAKQFSSKSSFEGNFDSLMQHANYNETNGIVVGSEISRIFAEIILQRVDNNVIVKLKDYQLSLGTDYEIRRYVDDFLVFANNKETLDVIETVCQKELSEYKLYLNDGKTSTISRPFVTSETKAREKTKILFRDYVNTYCVSDDCGHPIELKRPSAVYLNICQQFSMIASDYQVNYGVINRILLSEIVEFLSKSNDYLKSVLTVEHMLMITELSFFAFNLDMCFTASYKLCQIIIKITDIAFSFNDIEKLVPVKERIIWQLKQTIDIYNTSSHGTETNLEIQNLLIAARETINYTPPRDILKDIFKIKNKEVLNLDYFQICCLFYVMGDITYYNGLREWLSKKVAMLFEENCSSQPRKDAELSFLFLDMLTCPYLEPKYKKRIVKAYNGSNDVEKVLNSATNYKRWFFDWDYTHHIDEFIIKKQYHPSYI